MPYLMGKRSSALISWKVIIKAHAAIGAYSRVVHHYPLYIVGNEIERAFPIGCAVWRVCKSKRLQTKACCNVAHPNVEVVLGIPRIGAVRCGELHLINGDALAQKIEEKAFAFSFDAINAICRVSKRVFSGHNKLDLRVGCDLEENLSGVTRI